jgi:hypothetical protein
MDALSVARGIAKVALLAAVIAWFFGVRLPQPDGDASRAVAGVHHSLR